MIALLVLALTGTSKADALAQARALVPPGAAASSAAEFDPPWWYGGIYTITQEFTRGASDREGLTASFLTHLDSLGWQVDGVEERPGATIVEASSADVVSRSHLHGPPSTPATKGVIQLRYAPRNKFVVLGIGVLAGAAVAVAGVSGWTSVRGRS
jgi:hypothetical protein